MRPMSRMNDEAPCPDCDGESRRELSRARVVAVVDADQADVPAR